LRDDDIERIVRCFESYEDIKRFSKVISLEEIRENDHNLNIRRYADTSPPPENFDVRGILYGGIPLKEIEDEYICEVLDGFDVTALLVKKDDEYMNFKEAIKDKSQIREKLGDVSESVVDQFESWWDKYAVSLTQINSELKESEKIMHGFLKELGYE